MAVSRMTTNWYHYCTTLLAGLILSCPSPWPGRGAEVGDPTLSRSSLVVQAIAQDAAR